MLINTYYTDKVRSLTESSSLVRVWMIGNRSNGSVVAFTKFINPMFAVFAAEQISYTKVENVVVKKKYSIIITECFGAQEVDIYIFE